MITWMQRHKKWLVSTIWVSTIAFVGAGFVGWGNYNYGKKGGAVAVVGDREISINEFQREYSSLYGQYAQIFGKEFNKQMAEKLNLKDLAYKMAIQKNLILSYGDELGLTVTNEDIAKELLKYKAFIKNGKFDKSTYEKVLSRNGTTIKEFENSLKRNLLLEKIEKLFKITPSQSEVHALNQLLFLKDNIDVKVLSMSNIEVAKDEAAIKKYWDKNKANYLSDTKYDISYAFVDIKNKQYSLDELKKYYENFKSDFRKENDKIKSFEEAKDDVIKALEVKDTKTDALKEYLKYKKKEKQFKEKIVVAKNKLPYGKNNSTILKSKVGSLQKPFLYNNKYVIVKLNEIISPKVLSFEEAKASVTEDYINNQKNMKLKALSKKELANFNGKNIGWVDRNSDANIDGLDSRETSQFLNKLFSEDTKKGEVNLGSKVVLYKINDSKFAKYDEKRDKTVRETLSNLQNSELMDNLIKRLENRYEIQSSLDKKE
ncbi:peptidylprolyl isomerase [Arcobacter sp. CECT 8985]|uniref:peptidylprolyl isomerase n=1 Tax=Arcobacter sp. CECT 8985 TaxID=1935424 RepID=UPI00100C3426|nr:peptidylprolyl isomerase [Arcobacter sp. CECT 8985]RXJ87047.1 peptidylprolyl isomerase [Arcobacter sp. CECT 8985]